VRESGPPVLIGARGRIQINQNYFVARFCLEHLVLFEQDEGRFYLYSETDGAWHKVSQDVIKELLRFDWKKLAPKFGGARLLIMGNDVLFNALTSGVRSFSGRTGVFKRLPLGLLHVDNGMLKIRSDGTCELLHFDPQFHSRNPIPLSFNPAAESPRFRKMLDQQLGPDDADLFIRWCGSVLLEGNHAQRLVLIEGVQHSSKTTLINILEGIVGLHNSTALRTSHLDDRFEIGRFAGKTLLTAKDVRGDFLQHPSAQVIKRLVGNDYIPGEIKHAMGDIPVRGDFGVAVTCNETLLVRLRGENDVGAWRRRIIRFEFKRMVPVSDRIDHYDEVLLREEGEGILALIVQGAIAHLKELEKQGDFTLSASQKERVDSLLTQSQSLRFFVRDEIYANPESDLTTDEIISAYVDYCREKQWRPMPGKQVELQLRDLMMEFHDSNLGANITRNGKRARGYPDAALRQPKSHEEE
jgi:phage/plasmid-associated DNA primase